MTKPMTQAVAALARESRSYFREIEEGLKLYEADSGSTSALALARKRLRSISGAAGMIGLDGLAGAARHLNEVLETAGSAPMAFKGSVRPLIECARLIEGHLTDLAQGNNSDAGLRSVQRTLQLWGEGLVGLEDPHRVDDRAHAAHLSGQFVDVFREEAWAHLGAIAKGLRELKWNAGWPQPLDGTRRALHTLKGAAGVIGLYEASRIAHELEELIEEAQGAPEASAHQREAIQTRLHDSFRQLARSCGVPAGADQFRQPRGDGAAILGGAIEHSLTEVRLPWQTLEELGRVADELAIQTLPAVEGKELASLHAKVVDLIGCLQRAPMASIEDRLRRTVQATAERLGKEAVLEFEGGAADIDRMLLEQLTAPLEHLLRNAVDHGLEEAELRVAAGKSAAGRIRVRTYTKAAQLVVEVADDGGGINTARLRFKAVESGLLSLEDVLELSEAETLNLAFAAGLSTAPRVSEISGRGLGLAIVKDALHRMGGRKLVESLPGEGTTFRLIVPIRAGEPTAVRILEASVASGHYAIPAEAVVRVLRLTPGQFDWFESQWVLTLGDERIPMLHLDEVLGWPHRGGEPGAHSQVLLVESGGRRVAWIVDQIGGMPEVTIRRLEGVMSVVGPVPGVSGAVLSGDGVMLVLDVATLVAATAPVPATTRFASLEGTYLASKAS